MDAAGKFGLLFSVKIKHAYFKDDLCPYLMVEPDMPTKSLFKNRHLISKDYPGEIKIIAAMQAKERIAENEHYTFLLKVTDSAFFNITNLDFTGFPKQVFYFFNTLKNTKLSLKKCFVVENILSMTYDEGKIPSKIKILNQNKTEIYNGEVDKTANKFVYDMSACKSGLYTVVLSFAKADQKKTHTEVFYYSPLIRKEPVLGVIDIDVSGVRDTEEDNNINYIIQLEAANNT